ncbi:hypothetical protein BGX38DRAFT_1142140 [Terfezia claveryi]|nr:hypothetical protein BGX38DRAFT_1142140 [Terfezia claveryi]
MQALKREHTTPFEIALRALSQHVSPSTTSLRLIPEFGSISLKSVKPPTFSTYYETNLESPALQSLQFNKIILYTLPRRFDTPNHIPHHRRGTIWFNVPIKVWGMRVFSLPGIGVQGVEERGTSLGANRTTSLGTRLLLWVQNVLIVPTVCFRMQRLPKYAKYAKATSPMRSTLAYATPMQQAS